MSCCDFITVINGHVLDYEDADHSYRIDHERVPSITELLSVKYGHKYDGIPRATLERAAEAGTKMHEAVENYIVRQEDDGSEELRNFKFLMKQYDLKPIESEIPVILWIDGKPFAAGRLDLLLEKDGNSGLGDLKHTATLDRNYLTHQLNLYKLAYEQSYPGTSIEFLVGIHLRGEKRKLVALPMNYKYADEIINEYKEEHR